MFDCFSKPKFSAKCKSKIRMNKLRLEAIKKKRNAMGKYLKNDIVMLLKNGLHYDAYSRVEGLLIEQNRTSCYNFIEQFIECISKHVSIMQKHRTCPKECEKAIPSLIYAAARFADLPELCYLRTLFIKKYGNSLEPYLDQEFVLMLKAQPPTNGAKLQLLHDIAQEFSIEWDPKALEQKLFKPPPPEQVSHYDDENDNENKKPFYHKSIPHCGELSIDEEGENNTKNPTTRREGLSCSQKGEVASISPTKQNDNKDNGKNMQFCKRKSSVYDIKEGSGCLRSKSNPGSLRSGTAMNPIRRQDRACLFQLDMLTMHVHPKLPDYDDLATRLASLHGK